MDRRTLILGLGSIAAGFRSSSHAQSLPSQVTTWVVWKEIPTIVILSTEDDFRTRGVREAVDFWNAEFARLGSPFRFGAIVRLQIDLSRRSRYVESKESFACHREQHEGSQRRRDRCAVRRRRFQSIRIPFAGAPKSLGRDPKPSKISVLARCRAQYCRPRAGSCGWIGSQRRCSVTDVRRNCPVRPRSQ
jgi:hypothetical protein